MRRWLKRRKLRAAWISAFRAYQAAQAQERRAQLGKELDAAMHAYNKMIGVGQ